MNIARRRSPIAARTGMSRSKLVARPPAQRRVVFRRSAVARFALSAAQRRDAGGAEHALWDRWAIPAGIAVVLGWFFAVNGGRLFSVMKAGVEALAR